MSSSGAENYLKALWRGKEGESPRTGQMQRIEFNDKWEEIRREPMLVDLHQVVAAEKCIGEARTECPVEELL